MIEGVCALHRLLRDADAVRIWVEAATVRLERAVARDGEGLARRVGGTLAHVIVEALGLSGIRDSEAGVADR